MLFAIRNILLTIRKVGRIKKNKFAVAALDSELEVFVMHIAALSLDSGNEVHRSQRA